MAILITVLPSLIGSWNLVAIPVLIVLVIALYQVVFAIRYPSNLPLAGEPEGRRWFRLRTKWRYYTDCAALYRETYNQYTKHGRTVLLPGLGFRHDIAMPQSAMKWVMSRPENELSHVHAILEVVQIKRAFGHEKYKADQWPSMLVKTEINSLLESICADLNEELLVAFERYFGNNKESWKELDLQQTVRMVVGQAASRFTVGLPLCRNEEYLKDCWHLVDGMVLNGGLNGATPKALRPLLGPIFSRKVHRHINDIKKHFEPIYHQRLQDLSHNSEKDPEHAEPQDLLQMMLRFAQKERPNELYDLDCMTRRLCFANFAAMHQTSVLVTNILLNILGSNAEFSTISVLREEVSRVLGVDYEGDRAEWTKYKVAQMIRADSVARETLRMNSYSNRGVFRKVMIDGLVTEDGIKLPKGSYISFLGHPLQCDPDSFEDSFRYDPFRFSRAREVTAAANSRYPEKNGKPESNNLSFVSTSPQHLVFGHGNNSCPGRFLVDFEVKMIIAHVLRHYDIAFPEEYGGVRPANRWVAEACAPPAGVRINVKRRKA